MAVAAYAVYKALRKRTPGIVGRIVSAVAAELVMIVGYAVFEAFLYSSVTTALTGVAGNVVQGIGGVAFGVILYEGVIARIPAAKGIAAARK